MQIQQNFAPPPAKLAFSLVELSIVLVILGLLVGGVLAGQSLIRAAELRGVGVEMQRYRTAAQSFRDKYFYVPGDMPNATSFWGFAAGDGTGNDAPCAAAASTDAKTCNGNGDGRVTSWTGSAESFRFWQHLANAGMIEGAYDGVTAYGPSKLARTSWGMWNYQSFAGNIYLFRGMNGNVLNINGPGALTTADSFPLRPEEAWNIDTKMDDGLPGTGSINSFKGDGVATFCTNVAGVGPSGEAGGTYLLTNRNRDCYLLFRQSF